MIAQFEVERANRRVERAALQKPHEPKKQRQTYTVLDQGPSHGPGYTRPRTLGQKKTLKTSGHHESSLASLSNHPKQFNRRRTENTIYAQDYLKQWDKIKKIKPVLDNSKVNSTVASNLNASQLQNYISAPPVKAAKSTRRSNVTTKSTCISDSMTTSARMNTYQNAMHTTMNLSSLINLTTDNSSRAEINFKSGSYMNQTRASRSKQVIR